MHVTSGEEDLEEWKANRESRRKKVQWKTEALPVDEDADAADSAEASEVAADSVADSGEALEAEAAPVGPAVSGVVAAAVDVAEEDHHAEVPVVAAVSPTSQMPLAKAQHKKTG